MGKLKKAVALSYDNTNFKAPRVVAKAKGEAAKRMIEIALSSGVAIHQDGDLSEQLFLFDLEQVIPDNLYKVIAEIYAFIWSLEEEK